MCVIIKLLLHEHDFSGRDLWVLHGREFVPTQYSKAGVQYAIPVSLQRGSANYAGIIDYSHNDRLGIDDMHLADTSDNEFWCPASPVQEVSRECGWTCLSIWRGEWTRWDVQPISLRAH